MGIGLILLQAARLAATRIVQRAAVARYGTALSAGATPPAWARAGLASARVSEKVSSRSPWGTTGSATGTTQRFRNVFGDPSNAFFQPFRAVAPRFMARPAVPLRQRLAAETSIGGKARTFGGAVARGALTAADRTLVPGSALAAESGIYNLALGATKDFRDNFSLPRSDFSAQKGVTRPANIPFSRGARPGPYIPAPLEPEPGALPPIPFSRGRPPGPYSPGVPVPRTQLPSGPQSSVSSWERNPSILPPRGTVLSRATPPSLVGPTVTDPLEGAGAAARNEFENQMSSLNAGYQNMISQIRSMYETSETEEEKDMLRFQLADLEAQYGSGREAIGNLYAEKTQTIQALATRSRGETTQAREAAQQNYSQAAVDLLALQEARNAAQVESNRGLGIGSSRGTPYEGLLQTLAPIAGEYAQRIGDIGSEGLDYLSGLTESMGAARQGELQSLYAGTRAGTINEHSRDVATRVAAERLAMASALQSAMRSQLSTQASFAGSGSVQPTPVDYWNTAEDFGLTPGMTAEAFSAEFARRFGKLPEQYLMDHFLRTKEYFDTANAPSQQDPMSFEMDPRFLEKLNP